MFRETIAHAKLAVLKPFAIALWGTIARDDFGECESLLMGMPRRLIADILSGKTLLASFYFAHGIPYNIFFSEQF